MLKYKLISKTENEFIYAYYPEGNANVPGIIAISADKKGRVIAESKDDLGKRYAFHAIHGIDVTREDGTVAWY